MEENNVNAAPFVPPFPAPNNGPIGLIPVFKTIASLVMDSFGPYNPDNPYQQLFIDSFLREINKTYTMSLYTTLGIDKMRKFIHMDKDRSDLYLDYILRLQTACFTVGFDETDLNNLLFSSRNIIHTDPVLNSSYADIMPELYYVNNDPNLISMTQTYGLVHSYIILYKLLIPYFYKIIDDEGLKLSIITSQKEAEDKLREDKRNYIRSMASEEE